MKHGPSGRAGRRAASSSVAPIRPVSRAPCVLASHSPITPSQRVVIALEPLGPEIDPAAEQLSSVRLHLRHRGTEFGQEALEPALA
jgi:hypothetical protein